MLLSFFVFTSVQAEPLTFGDTAPDWTLPGVEDIPLGYYPDSKNKVSLILFWATWCPYCARLVPHLQKVYQQFEDKGLRLYAIDVFEDGEIDPKKYFDQKAYTYTLLLFGDSVAELYGVKGTPGLFLVDKNKKIIYSRKSGDSDEQVEQTLMQLIGEEIQ